MHRTCAGKGHRYVDYVRKLWERCSNATACTRRRQSVFQAHEWRVDRLGEFSRGNKFIEKYFGDESEWFDAAKRNYVRRMLVTDRQIHDGKVRMAVAAGGVVPVMG